VNPTAWLAPLIPVTLVVAAAAPTCVGAAAREPAPGRAQALTDCSWSFFADPRALAHGQSVLTACVTSRGRPVLVRVRDGTRRRTVVPLFARLEADDHNNPGIVFWHRRLWAFSSPHSGHIFPLNRHMFVHYRESRRPYGVTGGFGPVRSVSLPKGCGLGYTYPNLVVDRARLYLFVRGPCLQPIFTWTTDGRHWARARTLMLGHRRPSGRHRPYAKYAEGPDGISMIFSDGHPHSWTTSLFYMRMRGGRFYRADGSLIGTLRDLPFRAGALDHIYRHRDGGGRAWPMDVALDRSGSAVVVYTRTGSQGECFFYATFGARGWTSLLVAWAGGHYGGYGDGGASLRPEDPSWVALGANAGHGLPWHVRLLHTADEGASWTELPVPQPDGEANFRPVFPRGLPAAGPLQLEWVAGSEPSFRHYRTRLMWLRHA
jgi:BNR repeat-containing family member